ncbi:MAG TPA: phytanoyl-CoA dioxygenase family protein [Myxococcota bacterium]|nr:phytanoyl-CoA dioxygenase family protein [Myxococcota bacterium]
MLPTEQRRGFAEDGYLHIPGALAPDVVDAMQRRVWHRLAHNGADPNDRSTWSPERATNLKAIRTTDPLPADSPVVRGILDDVFGEGAWAAPKHWGQALVTFPSTKDWTVPTRVWHLDYPYWFPPDAVWGANLFLLVSDVAPRGGGTLVVKASHRVIARFVSSVDGLTTKKQKVLRQQFDAHHEWFRNLTRDSRDDRIERFMGRDTDVDGIAVRVVELTGQAGDAVLCHPWMVHAGSPNALSEPRLMRACRVYHRAFLALRHSPEPDKS